MTMLALVWGLIIAFCIVMYVTLDGFTLGTGLMMPFMNSDERDLAMSVILPTWDGNQTWLVLGTAGLYGAFPIAFSLLLPILYLPLLLMAIALLFRGIAFEFRLKSPEKKHRWDMVFMLSSLFVTLLQGMILGTLVEGFGMKDQHLVLLDQGFINYFSLFTAISLVFGYGLLSATRLVLKTEGVLQEKMFLAAIDCAYAVLFASVVISIWSPFINPHIYARWLTLANMLFLAPLPILNTLTFFLLLWSLHHRNDVLPYWASIIVFLCPYVGFTISIFPYIIPYQVPFWEAAAPSNTLMFILVGACIMLPVLLLYTGYAYHVFRGKVRDPIHY